MIQKTKHVINVLNILLKSWCVKDVIDIILVLIAVVITGHSIAECLYFSKYNFLFKELDIIVYKVIKSHKKAKNNA